MNPPSIPGAIALAAFATANVASLHATTYYVSPAGNDSLTKTQAANNINAPWRTIQNAATNMVAGDTCQIRGGTYRETVTVPISGTSAAPITFQSYGNEVATISGADPVTAPWTLDSTSVYSAPVPALTREVWTNIGGTGVASIPVGTAPTITDSLVNFEAPTNWADNYGTRVRGVFTAPASGSYTFWIASDDNSELWLSTDNTIASRQKIAWVSTWTNSREWTKEVNQKSAAVSLVQGQQYYIEALQKEGAGGDNLAVGWARPGQPTTAPSEIMPGSVFFTLGSGNQVFINGAMQPEARWPNAGSTFPWQDSTLAHPAPYSAIGNWSYLDTSGYSGTASGWFTDAQLPAPSGGRYGDNYWNGATVNIMSGLGWIMQSPAVTAYSAASKKITTTDGYGPLGGAYSFAPGNEYYLTGIRGEMDSPGEWFYDAAATGGPRLLLYSTATPAGVTVKKRSYGFNLSARSNVKLVNLDFLACTIQTDANTSRITYDGLVMNFLGHRNAVGSGIYGLTLRNGDVLRNSELAWDSRGLVALDGTDIRVINNHLHDSGYMPTWTRLLEAVNGDTNTSCAKNLISRNTMHDSGRSLMGFTGRASIVERNNLHDAMRLTTDGGIYYAANRAGENTVIQYNWFHNSSGPVGHGGAGVRGIYLDNHHNGWVVHHNIVSGVPGTGMHFGNRQNFDMVFNNTCWETDSGSMSPHSLVDGETGTNMFNNLFTAVPSGGEASWIDTDFRYNLYSDPSFVANSFQLAAGSPAIDKGTPIPGITSGYLGSAPDLGALESGGTDWGTSIGCSGTTSPFPTLVPEPTYPVGGLVMDFSNKVVDSSFESGSLASPWAWTGSNLSIMDLASVGHSAWDDGRVRTGSYSLKFIPSTGTSEVRQTVTGLLANRKYKFFCGVQKTDVNAVVKVGVRNYNGSTGALEITVPTTTDWQTAKTTQSLLMFELPFITGASNTSAEIYVKATNPTGSSAPVYVDDLAVLLSAGVTEYAPVSTSVQSSYLLGQTLEAETNFTVVTDVGAVATVGAQGTFNLAGNGQAVRLFDPGDTMRINFTVPKSGNYRLDVRVRSGDNANHTGYFDNGYAYKVDGQPVGFSAGAEAIGQETAAGWTAVYWGTMSSPGLFLSAGSHSIEIAAASYYGFVDTLKTFAEDAIEAETNFTVVTDTGTLATVGAQGTYNVAGNAQAVRIYDPGDTVGINFTVAQAGNYKLNVRVRSGWTGNDRGYFSNGYSYTVDNQPFAFTGDVTNIVHEIASGWASVYWGTMTSPAISLTAGTHTIKVTAVGTYGLVDCLASAVQTVMEAGNNFTVVTNTGTLATVGTQGTFNFAGNGQAVRIYDPGDVMRISFTTSQAGYHKLNVRVRSGWAGNDRGYFSGGYSYKVDGQPVIFTGDLSNIVNETASGWTSVYWGTMTSPSLYLSTGAHNVEITAVSSYGLVDYLDPQRLPAKW